LEFAKDKPELIEMGIDLCPIHVKDHYCGDKILRVLTSCNDYTVGIEIQNETNGITLIQFDLIKKKEINSVELEKNSHIFFDDRGEMYAVQDDTLNMVERQVRLSCFQTKYIDKKSFNQKFGFDKGIRFDSIRHEWLFLRDFILLPFSYMTFLIR
jgi:plasmid replication initiation protein